AQFNKVRAFL
ncbi:hypothetical protein D039_2050B, partial [Vibrio parahaemolyticus EKP-028]